MSQRIDLRCITSDNSLCDLERATNCRSVAERVLCSLSLNLDDNDSWVVWATVVLAVTEVTDPGLERGRVELLDARAVGLDGSGAGDGGPLAAVVEEGEVDDGVLFEVIGLAGLGVGVEDEVDAIVLLCCRISKVS